MLPEQSRLLTCKQMATQKNKQLSELIDATRGLAIILVVIGHIPGRAQDAIPFLQVSRDIIYLFHVPLLFLLSGFSTGFSSSKVESLYDCGGYIGKRFRRLFVPYLVLSIFYFVLQWVAQSFVSFKRPIGARLFLDILSYPELGPMGPLWFLYVLFEVSILYVGLKLLARSAWLCLAISVILAYLSWPERFGLASAFYHLPFFVLGRLCYERSALEGWNPWAGLVMTSLVFWFLGSLAGAFPPQLNLSLLTAFAGCFVSVSLVRILQNHQWHQFLAMTGRYAMAIYVLHMLIITVAFHLIVRLSGTGISVVGMGLMFLGALLFPMAFVKYGIGQSKLLTHLVLGTPVRNQ